MVENTILTKMEKIILIDKMRNELDLINIKKGRLNEFLDALRVSILPREIEVRINNMIRVELEELNFYENELKRDLTGVVYNG